MTWDEISNDVLAQSRKALTRFFSGKGCGDRTGDLVQETLTRISKRKDYEFETNGDFLKVCYGFARIILKEDRREQQKGRALEEFEDSREYGHSNPQSLHGIEKELYFRQLYDLLRPCLKDSEWQMLKDSFEMDRETQARNLGVSSANALGVRIFRAMRKVRKRFRELGRTSL